MDKKFIMVFMAGAALGIASMKLFNVKKPVGNLRIDESDPNEEPYIFLELHQNLGDLRTKKRVTLAVVNQNYLSAK